MSVDRSVRPRGRLARWPRLQAVSQWLRRTLSPSEREVERLRRHSAKALLQPWPVTSYDRHPALFGFAQLALAEVPAPKILSYGCSTGEEPLTLTRYLPSARITAIDINPRSIAIARNRAAKAAAANVEFRLAENPPAGAEAFDAIFCLSVLRHGELDAMVPADCSAILPFASFERIVTAFDHSLRPGGLLIIWGSNFDFRDSAIADRYDPIKLAAAQRHPGPVYGADDRLKHERGLDCFVFRKRD